MVFISPKPFEELKVSFICACIASLSSLSKTAFIPPLAMAEFDLKIFPFVIIATLLSLFLASIAAISPATPPPTTSTSYIILNSIHKVVVCFWSNFNICNF